MPMPRGKKFTCGYTTLSEIDAVPYRAIAEKMTERGFVMNHATARGIFNVAMEKLAHEMLTVITGSADDAEVARLARDERFQMYVCDVMEWLHYDVIAD